MTLFVVNAIIGLKPSSKLITPDLIPNNSIEPDFSAFAYSKFILNNMQETYPISNKEHVAFLLFWLHYFMFCSKSILIAKSILPLARLILEETHVSLSKLLLS